MPDNNDDLQNRLVALEQQFGLTTRNTTDVAHPNNTQVNATHVDNINWKALYKVLESEVEGLIFDPNAPQYVKTWASNIMEKLKNRLPQ